MAQPGGFQQQCGEQHADEAGIARQPEDIVKALITHWEPVFTDTPVDEHAIRAYLDEYVPARTAPDIDVPTYHDLCHVIRRSSDSAPGPDRLTYAA